MDLCTQFLTTADMLPVGDYVSPGLQIVRPDRCFPRLVQGDKQNHPWRYLRREISHNWYTDENNPVMGFINRDEAVLLYNIARQFRGMRALEIGCWFGWATCHLALAEVILDVVDPALALPLHRESVEQMLACCAAAEKVRLHAVESPDGLRKIASKNGEEWSLFFIDGDHESPAPERDVEECLRFAAPDAGFVFHDLASPDVARALRLLEARGFHVLLYQTMQIMGFAWRGRVTPVPHIPDPAMAWQLPHHLVGLPVSGVEFVGFSASQHAKILSQDQKLQRQDQALRELKTQVQWQAEEIRELRNYWRFRKAGRRLMKLLGHKG